MNKPLILILTLLFLTPISFADLCPSIATIKQQHLNGWQLQDSDDDKPLTAQRSSRFIHELDQFSLAEWVSKTKKSGIIHCIYRDKNGSTLEAYLTKKSFIPENSKHVWYQVTGSMQCAAGMEQCAFQQLAKK